MQEFLSGNGKKALLPEKGAYLIVVSKVYIDRDAGCIPVEAG
jgi:hypothetical protein